MAQRLITPTVSSESFHARRTTGALSVEPCRTDHGATPTLRKVIHIDMDAFYASV